jgi:glutathione S-transferase
MANSGIILHHYDASPFSAKVRQFLGLKGLDWHSVIMPNMMPKPDLVPLTGGYRRAPVMQIGADVFCDSQVILAEIERRHPEPKADIGPTWPVNLWSDRLFFPHTVAIIFGRLGDRVEPSFIADREKLSGRPFDVKGMMAAAGPARGQWRAHAAWIDRALVVAGTPYLTGDKPALVDLVAYMNIWFLSGSFPRLTETLLTGFDRLAAWRSRIAEVGEGIRTEMTGPEALRLACDAEPMPLPIVHDRNDAQSLDPGAAVLVAADDYGRDPIAGTLMAADAARIIIARDMPDLGRLHLHFPRASFTLTPAEHSVETAA